MPSERPGTPSTPPDWRRLRLWHIQPVRDLMVLALIVGVLYAGYALRPLTIPMLLAMLLAYLFEPVVKRITRGGRIGRQGAAVIILAGFFLFVVVPVLLAIGVASVQAAQVVKGVATNANGLVTALKVDDDRLRAQELENLPGFWKTVGKKFEQVRDTVVLETKRRAEEKNRSVPAPDGDKPTAPGKEQVEPGARPGPAAAADGGAQPTDAAKPKKEATRLEQELYSAAYNGIEWVRANADTLAKSLGQQVLVTGQGAVSTAIGIVESFARLAFGAVLTAFFFFFFSTGWGKVLEFWAGFIPERRKGKAIDLIVKMDRVIAGFVRGRLTICAIEACYFTVAYWFIGLPMPLVVGPLVGLLFLVPFLHVLSIPLGILLLWLQPSGVEWQNHWWWIVFAPLGVDFIGQFADDWLLSPKIQGKNTGMDMPTILFASMAGGALAGMYGLLVAIPVAACLKIFMSDVFWPRFRKWSRGEQTDFLPISTSEEVGGGPPKA